jgi:membrane peptidoglycan carboxypeptidase
MRYSQPPHQPPQRPAHRPGQPGPSRAARPRSQRPPGRNGPPPRRARRTWRDIVFSPGCIFGAVGVVSVLLFSMVISSCLAYDHYSDNLDDKIDELEGLGSYDFQSTFVLDRYGNELDVMFEEGRRTPIDLAQMPQHLINATIAVEDDTFYENEGIDLPSIARAAWQYVQHGRVISGGSTITQQLIRNVLFTEEYKNERSLNRKLDEAVLAMVLTQRMSKDDILELYLNEVYYGNLAYGVEEAARVYFGKPAAALTLAESALLAGLPQAPADLDPLNPDPAVQQRVQNRRALVLDLMVEEGYITRGEAEAAKNQPLSFIGPQVRLENAPHFTLYAERELKDLLGRELGLPETEIKKLLARGGLQVYTTIDMDMQRIAEEAARQQVQAMQGSNMNNAAVVVLRPGTGEILAMVGSVDYDNKAIDGEFNVATTGLRQPGSAMKPFTYAAALEKGWTAATIIWDTRIEIPQPGQQPYVPENYDNRYHGPVTVREALANSYNVPAVQTLRFLGAYDPQDTNALVDPFDLVGTSYQYGPQDLLGINERDAIDTLLRMMQRVGVESLGDDPAQYGVSLTLGGGAITPLELTNAYGALANGGTFIPATTIRCITNFDGEVIYEYEGGCPIGVSYADRSKRVLATQRQVIDPRIAFIISDILADEASRQPAMGVHSVLHTPGIPTSVKTGTTNGYKDNWTVGYTGNVVVGVWAGNTDNTSMINVSGLDGAAPLWNTVMTRIYDTPGLLDKVGPRRADDAHLQPPPGVRQEQFCNISRTALRDPATSCTPNRTEWFLDSPALVPGPDGSLTSPGPTAYQNTASNGPQPVAVGPSLVRVAVYPLAPPIADALTLRDALGRAVTPRYCQVPIEAAGAISGVQEQLFIAPPILAADDFGARQWAQASGVALLPRYVCAPEMLQGSPAASSGGSAPPGVTAYITSPMPGQTLPTGQPIPIMGTAAFPDGGQADFFRVLIRGGSFGGEWKTLGDINQPKNQGGVTNGVLEEIVPLPPGTYEIELQVVLNSQIVANYATSFRVG